MKVSRLLFSAVVSAALCLGTLVLPSSVAADQGTFVDRLVKAAEARTKVSVTYDGRYRVIGFPMGDVPDHLGVCSDVIIRSYRQVGVDLQELVHLDMKSNFSSYPNAWGLNRPDTNIDHRRVLNLETFLARKGTKLSLSDDPSAFQPGDLVTWRLGNRLPHIGIVTKRRSLDGNRPLIVHNVGAGTKLEDVLFDYPLHGHYRYHPEIDPEVGVEASE